MYFVVETASLKSISFLKPNPYIEFSIDDKTPRKTEVSKSTLQPKWNEKFIVLVTPYSQLHFRLLDHSAFRKDALIGEKRVYLYDILTHYNGKLENLELTLDLLSGNKMNYCQSKVGDLIMLFDRLKVDMSAVSPPHHHNPPCNPHLRPYTDIRQMNVAAVTPVSSPTISNTSKF